MAEYGYRPPYVWYVPKPVNDIEKVFDAFRILQKSFNGVKWADFQLKFSKQIEEEGIKGGHGGPMGARNWFTTFKYFGLAYIDRTNSVCLTDLGETFSDENRKETIINQLLKLQFPNPYQSKYVKGVNLYPFRVILRILLALPNNQISREELALFIMGLKSCSEQDIQSIANNILLFRQTKNKKKMKEEILNEHVRAVKKDFLRKGKELKSVSSARVWAIMYDYAGRHFLTLGYTGLCDYDKSEHTLTIQKNNLMNVQRILVNKMLEPNKEFDAEEDWFLHYGAVASSKKTAGRVTKQQYLLQKASLAAQKMKQEKGRIDTKTLSETFSIPFEELVKELQKQGILIENENMSEHNKIILNLTNAANKKGYAVHIGETEQKVYKRFKDISIEMRANHFGIPDSIFKQLKQIDIVWLKKDKITHVIEVENGEIERELHKFQDLVETLSIKVSFYLIVPDKNIPYAKRILDTPMCVRLGLDKRINLIPFSKAEHLLVHKSFQDTFSTSPPRAKHLNTPKT